MSRSPTHISLSDSRETKVELHQESTIKRPTTVVQNPYAVSSLNSTKVAPIASEILPLTSPKTPKSIDRRNQNVDASAAKVMESTPNNNSITNIKPRGKNAVCLNVSIVDRLPSRNITFTSAEILTISELAAGLAFPPKEIIRNQKLPSAKNTDISNRNSIDNGTSVRVTGEILHIDIIGKWILVGDPLAKVPPLKGKLHGGKNNGAAPNPYKNQKGANGYCANSKAISGGDAKRAVSRSNSSLLFGSRDKKRKLVTVKNHRGSSSLLMKRTLESTPAKRNVRSANGNMGVKSKSPVVMELIREKQRKCVPMVVIDISSVPSLGTSTIGDLVMIIGEVTECPLINSIAEKEKGTIATDDCCVDGSVGKDSTAMSGYEHTNGSSSLMNEGLKHAASLLASHTVNITTTTSSSSKNNAPSKLSTIEDGSSNCSNDCSEVDTVHNSDGVNCSANPSLSSSNDGNDGCYHDGSGRGGNYIKARILTNANGTDMNLLQETLILRRKHLKDRLKFIESASATVKAAVTSHKNIGVGPC